jgi:hypothetical protein
VAHARRPVFCFSLMPPPTVRVELNAPASAAAGEALTLTLTVTNAGTAPVDLYLRGRDITMDVTVTEARGGEVYHLLEDAVVPAVLRIETLRPCERLETHARWTVVDRQNQPLPPGTYTIRASILAEDDDLSATQAIVVGSP